MSTKTNNIEQDAIEIRSTNNNKITKTIFTEKEKQHKSELKVNKPEEKSREEI